MVPILQQSLVVKTNLQIEIKNNVIKLIKYPPFVLTNPIEYLRIKLIREYLRYRPPDVLLGSTNYTISLDIWGAGSTFVEMMNGYPCFQGLRDVNDQQDKIFWVTWTPTEETWPGVSHLPNYGPHKMCYYKGWRLGHAWNRLYDVYIPFAENID